MVLLLVWGFSFCSCRDFDLFHPAASGSVIINRLKKKKSKLFVPKHDSLGISSLEYWNIPRRDWKCSQRSEPARGEGRVARNLFQITPAPREALKGNKRMDEIQNLSRNKICTFCTQTQELNQFFVVFVFFLLEKRAEASESFAETRSRQRNNSNIKGKSREQAIKSELKGNTDVFTSWGNLWEQAMI